MAKTWRGCFSASAGFRTTKRSRSRGLAAGLAAAHAKGILHRDLKPANIMIDGRGEPRITDFGLAMTSDESAGSKIVVGTPAYMAPEQLEGKPASVQSDLYALGLILYEMFTGRRAPHRPHRSRQSYVLASSVFIAAIWTAVTVRVGLLGIATAQTIFNIAFFLTPAIDAPSWLLPSTIAPILFILVLTAFAFRTALGSQPMFSARLLDE
jgi:serine/threonine protein kinase